MHNHPVSRSLRLRLLSAEWRWSHSVRSRRVQHHLPEKVTVVISLCAQGKQLSVYEEVHSSECKGVPKHRSTSCHLPLCSATCKAAHQRQLTSCCNSVAQHNAVPALPTHQDQSLPRIIQEGFVFKKDKKNTKNPNSPVFNSTAKYQNRNILHKKIALNKTS